VSEWRKYRLDELGTLQRGRSRHRPRYAFHLYGGKYPFVQTGEIRTARKYIREYEQTYNQAGLEQSKLWPKNTLCITIAANIAELAILSFDACFPDSVLGFIADQSKADLNFIYYTLTHFQRELKHIGEGSVQDNINLGTFQDLLFPIPPLAEQKAIAAVLSSLDDKIDLLHRQNKTLEAMAETLFRQWFVIEAQEDWLEYSVSDFAEHIKINVVPAKFSNEVFHHYSLPAFDNGKSPTVELGIEILSNKYKVVEHSILVSKLNPRVPRIWPVCNLPSDNALCSTEFQVLKPKNDKLYGYLYFLLRSNDAMDALTMSASGTSGSHQRVRPEDILNIKTSISSIEQAKSYSSLVIPGIKKAQANLAQIRTLETLRDTLLPKLMSGEVRVSL
jgi:type I restriction enzyme, S subunit